MNTTENNKIIAKFMDYKFTTFKGIEYCKPYGHGLNCEDANLVEDLEQFSTDWNWIMEVVEKIESHGFTFEIKKNWAFITRKGEKIILRWEEDRNKIEAVYNACLEFIKWYNVQSK